MAETLPLQAPRPARPSTPAANQSLKVVIAFALVYVFWGSTYLAIGMTSAEGIPPFVMCALRFAIAGPLMLIACTLFGRRVRISRPEAVRLAAVGGLLLVAATEGWLGPSRTFLRDSLIVAVTPIWFLVLETFVFCGDRISRRGLIGLALGIYGIVILVWPKITHRDTLGVRQLIGSVSLLFSSSAGRSDRCSLPSGK